MPPPPKNRLHNKTGKLKCLNKPTSLLPLSQPQSQSITNNIQSSQHLDSGPSTSENVANITNAPTNDADQQFELELCWCIQTLETSLATGKLNAKQGNFVVAFFLKTIIIYILI